MCGALVVVELECVASRFALSRKWERREGERLPPRKRKTEGQGENEIYRQRLDHESPGSPGLVSANSSASPCLFSSLSPSSLSLLRLSAFSLSPSLYLPVSFCLNISSSASLPPFNVSSLPWGAQPPLWCARDGLVPVCCCCCCTVAAASPLQRSQEASNLLGRLLLQISLFGVGRLPGHHFKMLLLLLQLLLQQRPQQLPHAWPQRQQSRQLQGLHACLPTLTEDLGFRVWGLGFGV